MMNDVEVVGRQVANPFGGQSREVAARSSGALIGVEQQKAVAEVQARMIIARTNPRDVIRATDLILQDCTRPTLAHGALYQYARGGTDISGPSIRLAEAIAGRWGNIASGIKEISRHDGYSECVAYAWDLESGYYDERQFQVRHWRDSKKGGYALQDERDIYELIANMGQRRKRAVLLTVIPGDVVEAAVEQCEETLRASADTSPEALKKIVEAFAPYGVTQEAIETRIQRRFESIRPAQVIQLRRIYTSIKDGVSEPGDWFGLDPIVEAKVDTWRAEKDGKITEPEFEDVGDDEDALIAQGNVAVQLGKTVAGKWWDGLRPSQRGVLGARGRATGPYLPQWREGEQVTKQVLSGGPAEPPAEETTSVVPTSGVLKPTPPQADSFGLPLNDDEAWCENALREARAITTLPAMDAFQARWSSGPPKGIWFDRVERIPRELWDNFAVQVSQHETALFNAQKSQ